ncbi:adenylyltransferase/cytidyltransferase family protein [Candidatus Woesearchaeota archaeon]|nr:adenylyltransferase/cytidyltransferase family protein [Candidatus Woesearchaeota archaeon]
MSIALFLGRFQPFHNGHFAVVKKALQEHNVLVVAVGSAQEKRTEQNPFSYEERKEMIAAALRAEKLTGWKIVAIPDIPNDEEYVEHVRSIAGAWDVMYSGEDDDTRKLFKAKGEKVIVTGRINGIHATKLRKMMKDGKEWETLVPLAVADLIKTTLQNKPS